MRISPCIVRASRSCALHAADFERWGRTNAQEDKGRPTRNKNAVKHGKYSVPLRAARLVERRAALREQSGFLTSGFDCPGDRLRRDCDVLRALAGKLARRR